MSFNTNVFKQAAVVGQLDLTTNPNPSVISARFHDGTATTTLRAGEGVVLTDLGAPDTAGPPIVAKRALATGAIFGVRIASTKNGAAGVTDVTEVAFDGAVVWFEAAAALARGVHVTLTLGTPGRVEAIGANKLLGITLDKSTATGQLIRVLITARGL